MMIGAAILTGMVMMMTIEILGIVAEMTILRCMMTATTLMGITMRMILEITITATTIEI